MSELTTTKDIIHALGGVRAVADITGRKYSAAWNWLSAETFPTDTFLILTSALKERGYAAPARLWRMTAAERV